MSLKWLHKKTSENEIWQAGTLCFSYPVISPISLFWTSGSVLSEPSLSTTTKPVIGPTGFFLVPSNDDYHGNDNDNDNDSNSDSDNNNDNDEDNDDDNNDHDNDNK